MTHLVVFTGLPSRIGFVSYRYISFASPMAGTPAPAIAGTEFADRGAAWKELTGVCGDMVGGISRKLKENDEWQMELLDASKKPVFRIRLVAETLDQVAPIGAAPEPAGTYRVRKH